jgi:ribosomal protein S18 acetylase RimI-like enzyme
VALERLGPGELDAAAALLARAFSDDPVLSFLLGPGREGELRLIFGALSRDASRFGEVAGVRADGALAGVAVWLAPGAHPLSLRRELRALPDWGRLARTHPRAVPRLLRASRTLDALHPPEPHWFLSLLGVEPGLQRRGIGRGLVDPGLRRAEGMGVPVHLDTGRPDNVAWYRRLGFEVSAEVRAVPGAPPSWGMRTGG